MERFPAHVIRGASSPVGLARRAADSGAGFARSLARGALGAVDPRSWAAGDRSVQVLPYLTYALLASLLAGGTDPGPAASASQHVPGP